MMVSEGTVPILFQSFLPNGDLQQHSPRTRTAHKGTDLTRARCDSSHSYICGLCQCELASVSEVVAHHSKVHAKPQHEMSSSMPVHVPSFKCPKCDAMFFDTIESLLSHFDTTHGGRSSLISSLSPPLIERIFAIIHRSFVSTCRSAYSPMTDSSTKEFSSLHYEMNLPFPRDEMQWKQWFLSQFSAITSNKSTESVASTSSAPVLQEESSMAVELAPISVPPMAGDSNHISPPQDPAALEARRKRMEGNRRCGIKATKPFSAQQMLSRTCLECRIVFDNRCKYTRHLLDHKVATHPFTCPFKDCLMTYDTTVKLRSHLLRKHNTDAEELGSILSKFDHLKNKNSSPSMDDEMEENPPMASVSLTEGEELDVFANMGVKVEGATVKEELPDE